MDRVLTIYFGIVADGVEPGHGIEEAVADDDARAGAVLQAQEQGGLHQVHGLTVRTYLTTDGCLGHHDQLSYLCHLLIACSSTYPTRPSSTRTS